MIALPAFAGRLFTAIGVWRRGERCAPADDAGRPQRRAVRWRHPRSRRGGSGEDGSVATDREFELSAHFRSFRALRLCEGQAHRMDACKKQELAHDIG